jgi:hypothetical protein
MFGLQYFSEFKTPNTKHQTQIYSFRWQYTEVKLFSADGTAWAAGWESRTPPNFFQNPESYFDSGFSILFRKESIREGQACYFSGPFDRHLQV